MKSLLFLVVGAAIVVLPGELMFLLGCVGAAGFGGYLAKSGPVVGID